MRPDATNPPEAKDAPVDPVVWLHGPVPDACNLHEIIGWDDDYEIKLGVPLAAGWPSGVALAMDPDDPDAMGLADSLTNPLSLIVVSARLRRFLADLEIPYAEFLPVTIRDHKGRDVAAPYHIVNLAQHVDALDAAASNARRLAPSTMILGVDALVLRTDEAVVSELAGRPLFRLQEFGKPTLVDRAVARCIDEAGFTGIAWCEPADYTGQSL